jgi:hypothetical protein
MQRVIDDKSRAAPWFHSTLWWLVVHAVCHRSVDVTLDRVKFSKCHRGVQFPREKNSKPKVLWILIRPFLKMHYFYCVLHEVCIAKDNKMLSALLQCNLFILSRKAVFIQIKMSLSPAFSPSKGQQTLYLRLTL